MGLPREKTLEQAVAPRRRNTGTKTGSGLNRYRPSETWPLVMRWGRISLYAAALPLLAWCTYAAAHSKVFALTTIEITGHERLSRRDIERAVRQNVSGSLLLASLADVERNLESLTWVKHAQVTRMLPDQMRIRIQERKPFLLARLDGQDDLVWMDDEGVVLGGYEPAKDQQLPAIVVGFASDRSEKGREENRERIEAYKKLAWALDSGAPKYTAQLESVDLSHPGDVSVHLTGNKVVVHLGGEEFRGRLVRALEVLDAVQRRDAGGLERLQITDPRILQYADRINSVSVINPVQVSLGFRSVNEAIQTPANHPAVKTNEKNKPPAATHKPATGTQRKR